jgi:hypothetical protein
MSDTRPILVTVVSVSLVLGALVTCLAGLLVSQLTTTWGGEYDGVYAGVGLLVGAALATAAVGLWTGSAPGWLVVCLAASFPLMCVVGASSSSDLSALAPVAVIVWLALWLLVRRPKVAAWLRARDDRPRSPGGDSWL